MSKIDIAIVGGGFYGAMIACSIKSKFPNLSVLVLEKEKDLMMRASAINQARVHNGFHYPRSVVTAFRSRINFDKFLEDFHDAIFTEFDHYYAISKNGSKIAAENFEQFCKFVGLRYRTCRDVRHRLFNPDKIAAAYEIDEPVFNHQVLKEIIREKLDTYGIELSLGSNVNCVESCYPNKSTVHFHKENQTNSVTARLVLNCTYASLAEISNSIRTSLRYELAEIAFVRPPEEWSRKGFTVIDGPFCSSIPFPAEKLHSLTHVRYTPHTTWDAYRKLPDVELINERYNSAVTQMLRDTQTYVPAYEHAIHEFSKFEVKAILRKNDNNDGRPILFEQDKTNTTFYHILGGKIDNVYDIMNKIDQILVDL